jgi:hypothetical protein
MLQVLQVLQVLHETQMLRHSSAELLELWEPKEPKESKESTAQEQLTLLTPVANDGSSKFQHVPTVLNVAFKIISSDMLQRSDRSHEAESHDWIPVYSIIFLYSLTRSVIAATSTILSTPHLCNRRPQ